MGIITGIGFYFSGVNMALTTDSPLLIIISSLSEALTLSVIINFSILLIVWLMNVVFQEITSFVLCHSWLDQESI
ncbi:hypothetical protein HYU89_00285 [Candidatus Collierbacteria bacterium]|nr:hypothetical protein [Candidatus Collierbacteria bacterium]